MSKYVIGIDGGTMGVRCVILDLQGREVSSAYFETPTQYPRPGWVEQRAEDFMDLAVKSTAAAIAKGNIKGEDIAAVSFTNMRSTFVPVDKDGNFLHPIFIWQDLRGVEMYPWMEERMAKYGMDWAELYKISGFPKGAVWPSTKVYWYKKHFPELWDKTYKMVTPQALLIRALGARDDWYDDEADANWWQICNADTFEYDPKLAEVFEVDIDKYPTNYKSCVQVGQVPKDIAEKTGLKEGTPLIMGGGDQQCGAIGVGNVRKGLASICLGTAGLCIAYSDKPVRHPNAACHVLGHPGTGHWTMEGHASAAASAFRWVKNTISDVEVGAANLLGVDIYELLTAQAAKSTPGAKGMIFFPWLAGEACPYYEDKARAAFIGMTLAHTKADLYRAAMEGICFEMKQMLEALKAANFPKFELLRVTGGAARSDVWNQIQADIYGSPIETVEVSEATALGAAMLAAVGVGIYKDVVEAEKNMVHVDKRFEPIPANVKTYEELFQVFEYGFNDLRPRFFPGLVEFQSKF
jgi:xylulokinase